MTMKLGTRPERLDQLQQIAETAFDLFGESFLGEIRAGGTTADVVCGWLRILVVIRKAMEPLMPGDRLQLHVFGGVGDGI